MADFDPRQQFWDMAFCSLLGMNLHPGTTRDKSERKTMRELADLADEALKERDTRFP